MSLNPSRSTRFVFVESIEKIRYKGYEEKLGAKLLWPSFFEWDPSNYEGLCTEYSDKFKSWSDEEGIDYFQIIEQENYKITDIISLGIFLLPPEWRKDAWKDRNSPGWAKCETMVLAIIVIFLWDDWIDSTCHPGSNNYYRLKQAMASILEKIMNQDFQDRDALYKYLKSNHSILLDSKYRSALAIQQRLSENLREKHDIITREYPHLSIEYRMYIDYLTMYAGNGMELLEDSQKQDTHRCYTCAGYLWMDWFYVLNKLKLPPQIREDKYFKRLRYLATRLCYLVNDILSFEREAPKENPDNMIAHYVNRGLDLSTAIERTVEDHNSCVREVCELKNYLDSGKHPSPTDSDPATATQMDRDYKEAMRLTFVLAFTNFQAQVLSNRYNKNWYFD